MGDYRKIRPTESKSWLSSLPEEVYDLSDTSHMVRLLDALCGDSGVGAARKSLMLKRMQTALSETRFKDLDTVYSQLFNLPRLKDEEYDYDVSQLLTWEQQQEIQIKDAHYRGRISKYMLAFQYGGTKRGIELAAEAALGIECQVIEGREYYQSMGVPNGSDTNQSVGATNEADYNEYTVVVMTDEELTTEQRYAVYLTTKRLRPVDSVLTVRTRADIAEKLVLADEQDVYVEAKAVEASSEWWNVVRYVTGRPDWDYEKYGNQWVEPNVRREAPRQVLVNSQEEQNDFTFLAKSAKASSEHIGYYGAKHASLFETLGEKDATALMEAKNALSTASSRRYTASYYGGESVIDWSYPTAYTPALQAFFTEASRSSRFWSSDEKMPDGEPEWVEFELKKLVPINRIQMNASRKPVKITPYLSSAKDADGNRVWVRVVNRDGLELSYTSRTWGGTSLAGEMNTVDFSFQTAQADAVRIEVERLDVPFYQKVRDNALEEVMFPFSVELANVSLMYEIRQMGDYRNASYEDPFGNRVDTEMRVMGVENAVDGEENTYWVSQPNIGEDSVEYVVLDVRSNGEPSRINFIDVESVYDGCQLNVYSTERDEPGYWRPYPQVYELRSGRIELPTRRASFLKLEFTRLCAMPYQVTMDEIKVRTRLYPWAIQNYFKKQAVSTYKITSAQQLLASPSDSDYKVENVYSELGIADVYQAIETEKKAPSEEPTNTMYLGMLFTGDAYRQSQQSQIRAVYGDEMAKEQSLVANMKKATPIDEPYVKYRFYEEGEHEYEVKEYERSFNLAYVVGVKSLRPGFTGHVMSIDSNETFVLTMADGRFVSENNGWELVNDERFQVSTDEKLCSFESVDVQTLTQFKTFDFAVNQNPPREVFSHPSDMLEEWSGLNSTVERTEFGVSGNVLQANLAQSGKTGIVSENKLVRSKAVATAQVDVFTLYDGEWIFECQDLYGENLFSMKYTVKKGKWNTLGAVFMPQPGGAWWNSDYSYRAKVPLTGMLAEGMGIFVPNIDFDALQQAGITTDAFKDVRLVYFNGVEAQEIDCDVTDNMEIWFKVQQDLPSGVSADGAYHFDLKTFIGSYYFYFGNKNETTDPKLDYRNVFQGRGYLSTGEQRDSGIDFTESQQFVDITEDYRLSSGAGFISMEYTPVTALKSVPAGTVGTAEVRFLLDYEDDEKKVQLYTYEEQLTFVIVESDGFENAFVSKYDPDKPLFASEQKSYILVEWGERGSQPVYKDGVIDPEDKSRRKIGMYVDSATPLECIPNVYDEVRYNNGTY